METEQQYSHMERVLLGVVFVLERLNQYIYGLPITVQSDYKPLMSIWKKTHCGSQSKTPESTTETVKI